MEIKEFIKNKESLSNSKELEQEILQMVNYQLLYHDSKIDSIEINHKYIHENNKLDETLNLSEILDDGNSVIKLNDKFKNLFDDNLDFLVENWLNNGKIEIDNSTYNVYNGTGNYSTIKILIEDNIDITSLI